MTQSLDRIAADLTQGLPIVTHEERGIRQTDRVAIDDGKGVWDIRSFQDEVILCDLSREGAGLIGHYPIDQGYPCNLSLTLCGATTSPIKAIVRNCEPIADGKYRIGLRSDECDPSYLESMSVIEHMIDQARRQSLDH